jgi:hypothetical protein
MLSAAFGQSWAYQVNVKDSAAQKLAEADTTAATAPVGLRPSRGDYFGL